LAGLGPAEAVEDGVGISRVANEGVSLVDRDLTAEDGRATPIAFLKDLMEVTTGAAAQAHRIGRCGGN